MKNNSQYDIMIVRYLAGEINADEKVFIENWINESDANYIYFEQLKNTWQLAATKQTLDYVLEEINVDEKWNAFKNNMHLKENNTTPSHTQQHSVTEDFSDEIPTLKQRTSKLWVRIAVAASLLLIISLGWMFLSNKNQDIPIAQNPTKKTDSLVFVDKHESNYSGTDKRIILSDGSLIVLANKSEIFYREPFIDRRDITLIGKAYFKEIDDKSKPFTVFSGAISTTALGTEFTVTALKNTNQIIVRLYEGKVVIKNTNKDDKRLKNDVYLLPGQQFIYGNQVTEKVTAIKVNKVVPEQIMVEESTLDNPSIPENAEEPYFMFNNQTLSAVLDDLSALYNINIHYDKSKLQNIYFTAKYRRSELLENILNRIGILNNLQITRKDSVFIIENK